MLINKRKLTADKVAFFTCLSTSLGMFIAGLLIPPPGIVDGSVLSAGGILLGFATLAVTAQSIQDGRVAKFQHGNVEVCIGDKDNTEQAA